jgi:hypothetical protein
MRKVLAAVTSAVLAGSAMVVATPPVAAKTTYKACVKKSTGEVRFLVGKKKKKKKCKKGWKKVSWTKAGPKGGPGVSGPTGATGPRASMGTVVDRDGAVVGEALTTLNAPIALFIVRIDGGTFLYYGNGWLVPTGGVYYKDAACTGTAYDRAGSIQERDLVLASPSERRVYRVSSPTLGPSSAFRFAGTAEAVTNVQFYYRDDAGACVATGALFTGYAMPLTPVSAPPDHPGPLQVV